MTLSHILILVSGASGAILLIRLIASRNWGRCSSKQSLTGKTYIVTGGNSGIGKQVVIGVAARGARVVVACRNLDQAEQEFASFPLVSCKHLDLQSFASVVKFVEEVGSSLDRVDVLVSNAGIYGPPFALTEDGFETQHEVNHLAHALLQLLLLPKLEASGEVSNPSRIVSVTSTRALRADLLWDEMTKNKATAESYNRSKSYDSSKLAAALFNMELAERLKHRNAPVSVMLASPGLVWTNLFRHEKKSALMMLLMAPIAIAFLRTPKQGAQTVLECATSENLSESRFSGKFFRNCKQSSRFDKRADPSEMNQVWIKTIEATKNILPQAICSEFQLDD